jgi:hypothetical protein
MERLRRCSLAKYSVMSSSELFSFLRMIAHDHEFTIRQLTSAAAIQSAIGRTATEHINVRT